MQARTTYRQLPPEERNAISSMTQQVSSMLAMGSMPARQAGIISRETWRNTCSYPGCNSVSSQAFFRARRADARPMAKLDAQAAFGGTEFTRQE